MPIKTTDRALLIGRRVREACDDIGLSNSELARRTGLPRRTIVRITNGHNEADVATLELISRETGKPLDFFRAEGATPAPDRIRLAAEGLVEALVAELRQTVSAEIAERVGALA